MRALLLVAALCAAPAALEAQATFYYRLPQARAQDSTSVLRQNLRQLLGIRDTSKTPGVVVLRDSSQMAVCPMPVHVPDTSKYGSGKPPAVVPSLFSMPVANNACRNPLLKK